MTDSFMYCLVFKLLSERAAGPVAKLAGGLVQGLVSSFQ